MTDTTAPFQGQGSKSYRAYVLGALLVIYTFNFVDRILIAIVQEAIKEDLNVSNFEMGILGGPAFAILYTLCGIPIARYAERHHRINIVAIGAAVWSAMTALCGFAANYTQLLLARIGVGIGEAACIPPSHSVISDYFPADRRASALSIYALGIPIGASLAAIGGGWLTQNFDWRAAFWLLGAPGLLAAVVLKLTVKEPPRTGITTTKAPSFSEALKTLGGKPAYWHAAFGGALMSFVGYGSSQFLVSYMVRSYDLAPTLPEEIAIASYTFGLIAGVATGLGTFLGGFLADRMAPKHPRVLAWLPALGMVIAIPLYILSFIQTEFMWAFAFLMVAPIFHYMYLGPMYGVVHSVAQPLQRATAVAIVLLVVNLIGYGLGPPFVGFANDFFASQILAESGLTMAQCGEAANAAACAAAEATGLKYALGCTILVLAWAAVHVLLVGRTIVKDRVS